MADLFDIREQYFNINSLTVFFKVVSSDIVFNFLKEINMFCKLLIRNILLFFWGTDSGEKNYTVYVLILCVQIVTLILTFLCFDSVPIALMTFAVDWA